MASISSSACGPAWKKQQVYAFFKNYPECLKKNDWSDLAVPTGRNASHLQAFYNYFSEYLGSRSKSAKGLLSKVQDLYEDTNTNASTPTTSNSMSTTPNQSDRPSHSRRTTEAPSSSSSSSAAFFNTFSPTHDEKEVVALAGLMQMSATRSSSKRVEIAAAIDNDPDDTFGPRRLFSPSGKRKREKPTTPSQPKKQKRTPKKTSESQIQAAAAQAREKLLNVPKAQTQEQAAMATKFNSFVNNPKAVQRCVYEFFYSNIDRAILNDSDDFEDQIRSSFPKISEMEKMTQFQCFYMRKKMKMKPRRLSRAFLAGERKRLEIARHHVRLLQHGIQPAGDNIKLPSEIPLPLTIGNRVLARYPHVSANINTNTNTNTNTNMNTHTNINTNTNTNASNTTTANGTSIGDPTNCNSNLNTNTNLNTNMNTNTATNTNTNTNPNLNTTTNLNTNMNMNMNTHTTTNTNMNPNMNMNTATNTTTNATNPTTNTIPIGVIYKNTTHNNNNNDSTHASRAPKQTRSCFDVYPGFIIGVRATHGTYRIEFDDETLGIHTIADTDVASEQPIERIPSAILMKERVIMPSAGISEMPVARATSSPSMSSAHRSGKPSNLAQTSQSLTKKQDWTDRTKREVHTGSAHRVMNENFADGRKCIAMSIACRQRRDEQGMRLSQLSLTGLIARMTLLKKRLLMKQNDLNHEAQHLFLQDFSPSGLAVEPAFVEQHRFLRHYIAAIGELIVTALDEFALSSKQLNTALLVTSEDHFQSISKKCSTELAKLFGDAASATSVHARFSRYYSSILVMIRECVRQQLTAYHTTAIVKKAMVQWAPQGEANKQLVEDLKLQIATLCSSITDVKGDGSNIKLLGSLWN